MQNTIIQVKPMLVSDILILTSFSSNISVQMYSTLKTLSSNRAQNRRQAGNMALITIFKSQELLCRPLKTCTNSHSLFLVVSSFRKVHINLFTMSG